MKSPKFPLFLAAFLALCLALPLNAEEKTFGNYTIRMTVDRPDGIYKLGEQCSFTLLVTKDGVGAKGIDAEWTVSKDSVAPYVTGTIKTDAEGKAHFTGSLDEPGFVRCTALLELPGLKGKKNIQSGAAYEPLKIKPSMPPPDDFVQYWDKQKSILAEIPMNLKITPIESKNPEVLLFNVEADSFNGKLYGVLAYPKNAKPKSLPAILTCHGGGVRSSYANASGPYSHVAWSPGKWAAMGFVALDFNALGVPNFQPLDYYANLQKTTLSQYWYHGAESRDTSYFRELYMRVLRAMDIIMMQPQWDGKILVVGGRSKGGGQAIFAAGMNPRVSFVFAHIPSMCDMTGVLIGRTNGWPRDLAAVKMDSRERLDFQRSLEGNTRKGIDANGVDAQNKVKYNLNTIQESRYIDAMNFAGMVTADTFFSVGFCDKICAPTSGYAAYNNLKSKNKEMLNKVDMGHASDQPSNVAAEAAVMAHVKKMRGETN